MIQRLTDSLTQLASTGNLRQLPDHNAGDSLIDLTTNDYLGLARRTDLIDQFYAEATPGQLAPTSAASRLLASSQREHTRLESLLSDLYCRPALVMNSGYHANTGTIAALASKQTMILADRLVHASAIDGIMLSGAPFSRFRHNDFDHLEQLIGRNSGKYAEILVIVESIYSMDGDRADIERLIDIKRRFPQITLYVDEAHAIGVAGRQGLGLVASSSAPEMIDVVIGTLGKAAASSGAFVVTSQLIKDYLINRCRSLIFSTAIAPVNAAWSRFVMERIPYMDAERRWLNEISERISATLDLSTPSHILPIIVGDPRKAVEQSLALRDEGIKVLPIRTPTVPPGTERLRLSLSAALTADEVDKVIAALKRPRS